MKTFQTTTCIAPIISVGTYWGHFDYESLWGEDAKEEHEEGRYVCNDYSHKKLGEAIAAEATKVFAHEEPFKELGVKAIKATEFHSPSEYNFCDDWLDLSFEVEDDFLDRAEKKVFDPKYKERFEAYIREHWRSRDGFVSSMPADCLYEMHEVFRQLREDDCGVDDMRCFGSVVALLYEAARQEGELVDEEDDAFYASMTGQLLERFGGNHSLSEFCTILDADEVHKMYPTVKLMLDELAAVRRDVADKLRKYLECAVSEDAKKRAQEAADGIAKFINSFEGRVKEAVELWHPSCHDVKYRLATLRHEWMMFFGKDGDACKKGVPAQMEMAI